MTELREAIRGYHRGEVNELLEHVAQAVESGRPTEPFLPADRTFSMQLRGDRHSDVDTLLETLRSPSPDYTLHTPRT
jgi:cell division septum initiation protein DivIVA